MSLLTNDEAIKDSFKRVKEHMQALEKELRADREFIIVQNQRLEYLEKSFKDLNNKPIKEMKKEEKITFEDSSVNISSTKSDLEDNLPSEEPIIYSKVESPVERKGYLATPLRHHANTSTPFRHSGTDSGTSFDRLDIEEIKSKLNKVFFSLTNREFKVFMAVYSLEEESKSPVTYQELAKSLDLSSSSIRDYISELIRKGAPIKKEKTRNGLVYVSVLKEFKDLNLISKLIAFRNMSSEQKSIFDSFI